MVPNFLHVHVQYRSMNLKKDRVIWVFLGCI